MGGSITGGGGGNGKPGGNRGGMPFIWSWSFIGIESKNPADCCCAGACGGLLIPGGGLLPMRPRSNSSTVHTFFKAVGNGGFGFGNGKFDGLSQTPGRGMIPSFSSSTKWERLFSMSTSTSF